MKPYIIIVIIDVGLGPLVVIVPFVSYIYQGGLAIWIMSWILFCIDV